VIAHLTSVTLVLVTTCVRRLPAEVQVGEAHGLIEGSVINCDNVLTVPKSALAVRRGALGSAELYALDRALRLALGLD
jgi:mRNA interferase MazF